jgi:hypothetical protein
MNLDEMRGFVNEVEGASLGDLIDRASDDVGAALRRSLR